MFCGRTSVTAPVSTTPSTVECRMSASARSPRRKYSAVSRVFQPHVGVDFSHDSLDSRTFVPLGGSQPPGPVQIAVHVRCPRHPRFAQGLFLSLRSTPRTCVLAGLLPAFPYPAQRVVVAQMSRSMRDAVLHCAKRGAVAVEFNRPTRWCSTVRDGQCCCCRDARIFADCINLGRHRHPPFACVHHGLVGPASASSTVRSRCCAVIAICLPGFRLRRPWRPPRAPLRGTPALSPLYMGRALRVIAWGFWLGEGLAGGLLGRRPGMVDAIAMDANPRLRGCRG